MLLYCRLSCKVSDEKSVIFIFVPLYVVCPTICPPKVLRFSVYPWFYDVSLVWLLYVYSSLSSFRILNLRVYRFHQILTVPAIISLSVFSASPTFSIWYYSTGTIWYHLVRALDCWILFRRSLRLCFFFFPQFFSSLCFILGILLFEVYGSFFLQCLSAVNPIWCFSFSLQVIIFIISI